MKIVSLLPILAYGDAVGNDALAIYHGLKDAGFESVIAAESIDSRIEDKENVVHAHDLKFISDEDVVIYHFSTGHKLNQKFGELQCKKILRYHNITPPHFFCGYNKNLLLNCMQGYRELLQLRNRIDFCIADSDYNKKELMRMGFDCEIYVVPILIPFEDYQKEPNQDILEKYLDDEYTKFLFTGRISPNKRQEDVIAVFHLYQKLYNPKSRLFLVGKYDGMETYYDKLVRYAENLGTQNIVFTGQIGFSEILAYYRLADLFLCMSDHEGFCVPLVEAMNFEIPIVARTAAAVPETMGKGGIVVSREVSLEEIAGVCHKLLNDRNLYNTVEMYQKEQLEIFSYTHVKELLLDVVGLITKNETKEVN